MAAGCGDIHGSACEFLDYRCIVDRTDSIPGRSTSMAYLVQVLRGTGLGAQLPHSTASKQRTASQRQQFTTAPKLCRAPCKNERVPQLELVGSWPGTKNLTGQHVTLATQLSLAR